MYSVLNGKPLEQWKVTELKEELKKRGLPVRGLKDELIKRLDFAILDDEKDDKEQQEETVQNEEEDNIDKEQQEELAENEEEDTIDKEHQEETVQNEEEDTTDKEQQEGTIQNEEEDTTDKEQQEETVQNEEEDNTDKEQQEGTVENESVMENVENGANSETQVNENVEPVHNEEEDTTDKEQQEGAVQNESVMENVENGANSETQVTMVVEDDWVKINKGSEGNVEPRGSNDGEVQPINTPVVEEAIHKETDSTVGKVGTPEPQISNVEEAQSVSTPITDDVRENTENTIESVEIDETMADAGLVDDTSSVMGQDVGSLSFTDSTAAIMDATDSAAVLMDATDSAAVLMDATDSAAVDEVVEVSVEEVVEVSVEEVVTVTQSVVTEVLFSDEELQNKEADREPEVPNHPSGDSMHSMSNQNSQVSEVSRDLGFQVRSESISTDCVSIIEKNELKDNLNADNFHIEQNVVMPEMVQPSSNDVCPDDGALRSLEGQEPCENQESMEGLDDTSATVNLDKKNDATDALLEKLNLDRSSGDESMEEDISEGKHVESIHNSDGMDEKNSLPEVNGVNKENHVGVTIESLFDKGTSAEGMISHAVPAEKRKLQDQEVGKTNEIPKRQRRWNSETLKVPELQASTLKSGTTPKDASPSDAPKRSVAKSGSTLSPEIARERVVPPSAKPPTTSLRIDNFLRPFTLKAVQELLAKTGAVSSFWMDHIKTHCYVMYSSVEEAIETRNAVYNLQWPTNGGKLLVADFVDPQDVKTRAEAPAPAPVSTTPKTLVSAQLSSRPPPEASPRLAVQRKQLPPPPPMTSEPPPPTKERLPLPPPPPLPQIEEPPIVTLDDLFRKTTATPRIYFLPLPEQEVAAKLARQGKNTK